MSLLFSYDFEKHMMITLASIAVSLTVGLVLLSMQYAHGQTENASSAVDKLIEDAKRGMEEQKGRDTIDQEYITEIRNRIENSTCFDPDADNFDRDEWNDQWEEYTRELAENYLNVCVGAGCIE